MNTYLEWKKNTHYGNGEPILLVKRLESLGLRENEVKKVLEVINNTCGYCWESDSNNCTCMRDE